MPHCIRITITMPPALKHRMDKAASNMPVNWSSIARRAFREKLTQMSEPNNEVQEALDWLDELSQDVSHLRSLYESLSQAARDQER